jgi:hypothetical protein
MELETGTATLSTARSGALQLYIKKDIAEKIKLPLGKNLKVTWNEETKQLIVEKL